MVMKTKNTPVPNNYSLFGVTTRIIVELLANYSLFRANYSFFTTIPDSFKLSENYLRAIRSPVNYPF